MDIIENYKKVMRNYVGFEGRARRSEFWLFVLAVFIMQAIAGILDAVIGMGLFVALVGIVHFVPSLAVAARRLHDTDRSGWWLLIGLIPLIGIIVLLVFYCLEGTKGPNRFGSEPAN